MSVTPSSTAVGSILTTSTPRDSAGHSASSSSSSRHTIGKLGSSSKEEKILNHYTGELLADGSQKKLELADHFKRLAYLRKEADLLDKTDWQYEPVEKLMGK